VTRVDFYVLPDSNSPDKFICALSNKIRKQGLPIYIHTDDRSKASQIDDLLWTFKDISFLPHAMADEPLDESTPITIGWDGTSPNSKEVMINLSDKIPDNATSFSRVIEIVVADEGSRGRSRENFKQYRDLGFDIHSHNLESSNV
jgi:DNA polymerase-3 subunit chi